MSTFYFKMHINYIHALKIIARLYIDKHITFSRAFYIIYMLLYRMMTTGSSDVK